MGRAERWAQAQTGHAQVQPGGGVDLRHLEGLAGAITKRTKVVVVSTPNNPTGTVNTEEELLSFVRSLPDHVVCVVDEAYCDFADHAPDIRPLIREGRNIIGLRTFSKAYGLASLRIGYGYSTAPLASLMDCG